MEVSSDCASVIEPLAQGSCRIRVCAHGLCGRIGAFSIRPVTDYEPDGCPAPTFTIRSFEPRDHAAVRQLYTDGLLGGKRSPTNDTGFDIDDVELAYMRTDGSHFWVAVDAQDHVVGMIGVQQLDAGVGEIRRLRVNTNHRRRGIGSALLQRALEFCRDQGLLKVTLDTWMEREAALRLFQKFNFRHDKTRETAGKQLLFFYLDLYGSEKTDQT